MTIPPSSLPKRQPARNLPSDGPYCMRESTMPQSGYDSSLDHPNVEASSDRPLPWRNGGCARLLIADDAPIIRDGLRNLIESQPELCVAGESSVGAEVVTLVRELKPDL